MIAEEVREGAHAVVVIPVGSVDALLEQQLDAVLRQRAPFPYEVVLACNNPAPEARRRLAALVRGTGDPRVRAVRADEVRGPAHARNVGARSSNAEVIAFCDADDEVAPDWLAQVVPPAADDVLVGGHLDEEKFAIPEQTAWRPPATPGALPTFLGVPYAVSANMAISRAAFERVGGFDVSLVRCEDIALSWDHQRAGGRLVYAPGAVVHYRHRRGVSHLVRQHFLYGRGMSQVLARHPMPACAQAGRGSAAADPSSATAADRGPRLGLRMLRPNNQPLAGRSLVGQVVRRGSIATGRVVGLVEQARHANKRRRRSAPPADHAGRPAAVREASRVP